MTAANILLIGAPGAGKTACGKSLAEKMGWTFLDTDQLIEADKGLAIPEIFAGEGEDCFRKLEADLLDNLVTKSKRPGSAPCVIATGGGMPVDPRNFQQLVKLGSIFYLQAPAETLFARIERQDHRPLIDGKNIDSSCNVKLERLKDLLKMRCAIYEKAHHTIDTSGLSPDDVACRIMTIAGLIGKPK